MDERLSKVLVLSIDEVMRAMGIDPESVSSDITWDELADWFVLRGRVELGYYGLTDGLDEGAA